MFRGNSKTTLIVVAIMVIVCVVGGIAFAFAFSGGSLFKEVDYKSLDAVYDVQKDGTVIVTETWDIDYDDAKKCFYRTFPKTNDGRNVTILNATVDGKAYSYMKAEKDPEYQDLPSGTFYQYDGSSRTEIGVYFTQKAVERKVTLVYEIDNFIVGYNDTAVLYAQIINDGFEAIGKISATINLPGDAEMGWLHHKNGNRIKNSYFNIDNKSKIVLTGEKNKAENYFETRILIPNEVFTGLTNTSDKDVKSSIIAQEKKWQDDYLKEQRVYKICAIVDIVLCIVAVGVLVILIIVLKKKTKPHKVQEYEYYRDMPEGIDTANFGYIYYYKKGGFNGKNKDNTIAGTVLDFVRRGYLKMDENGYFEVMEGVNLNELTSSEYVIFDILRNTAQVNGETGVFKMKDIEKLCRTRSDALTLESQLKSYDRNASTLNGVELKEKKTYFHNLMSGISVVAVVLALMIFILAEGMFVFTAVSVFACGIILGFTSMIIKPRLNLTGETYYQKLVGLERYLEDFSNLDEHEIPQLKIWEQYMVYATIMGISEKVLKALKVKCPEFFEMDDMGRHSYFYYYYTPYYMRHGFIAHSVGSSFSNLSNTVRSIAHPVNTGSGRGGGGFGGSGGGFSGGGGGFGGGGGSR